MQADRFTIKSQEALRSAIDLAASSRHSQVQPEHLLAVLLDQADSVVPGVLRKLGVATQGLRGQLRAALDGLPTLGAAAEPTTAPELLQVLRASEHEMRELKDEYVSTEHLLLSLAGHNSKAGEALRAAGATRSEEHTSELQSRQYLVCRLLLEKSTVEHRLLVHDVGAAAYR